MPAKQNAYDYIIVGAGSAGCVLAARLTEDPHSRVLLLEAGGPDKAKEIHIPAAFSKLYKTAVDWNYSTEPEPCLHNRRLYWPRGKMLGGSSSMNAMIYIRGNRLDFDHWPASEIRAGVSMTSFPTSRNRRCKREANRNSTARVGHCMSQIYAA
jgi:choline dehydrogenase-like flavoprotein